MGANSVRVLAKSALNSESFSIASNAGLQRCETVAWYVRIERSTGDALAEIAGSCRSSGVWRARPMSERHRLKA
jgi:hypothetical protein